MSWIEVVAAGLLLIGSALVLFAIRVADTYDAPPRDAVPQRREEPYRRAA